MTIRYKYLKDDVCTQYRSFHQQIQQFISGWLVQQLMYEKNVCSCYGLNKNFNKTVSRAKGSDSQYWYKLINGMSIRSHHKIKAIESFSPGITEHLCHPLCFVLNIPNRYFLAFNGVLKTLQMPKKLKNHNSIIQQLNSNPVEDHLSIYIKSLNKLYPLIFNSYFACAEHDILEIERLKERIEYHLDDAIRTWRYPKTASCLSNLITNKLDSLTTINLKYW